MIKDNIGKVKKPVVGFNPHADNVKHVGGKPPKHNELWKEWFKAYAVKNWIKIWAERSVSYKNPCNFFVLKKHDFFNLSFDINICGGSEKEVMRPVHYVKIKLRAPGATRLKYSHFEMLWN